MVPPQRHPAGGLFPGRPAAPAFRGGGPALHRGVNGQEAGSHTGGYLPFALDVTELIEGDAFTLELRVTDPTDTGSLSRGKQRLKNTGIWYTPQSGIWQTVWMECVPENYLRSLRITPKAGGKCGPHSAGGG